MQILLDQQTTIGAEDERVGECERVKKKEERDKVEREGRGNK